MPVILSPPQQITAEQFAADERWEKFTELIDGEVVTVSPARYEHNRIALRFIFLFAEFCRTSGGEFRYGGDNDGFLISRNPDTILCPDASLFRSREGVLETTWLEFAPDLAVEIISPSESALCVLLKRKKYLNAGSEQVWIVDVKNEQLEVYFRDGRKLIASSGVAMNCEGIAEGLVVKLTEIFAPI